MQHGRRAQHRMPGEVQLLILGEDPQPGRPGCQVHAGQERRFELPDLPCHVLHHRRGQAGRVQHDHQAVTAQRPPGEDIDVPVLQVKQDDLAHIRYGSRPPRPLTAPAPNRPQTGDALIILTFSSQRHVRTRLGHVCGWLPEPWPRASTVWGPRLSAERWNGSATRSLHDLESGSFSLGPGNEQHAQPGVVAGLMV
jgi:hypothetical protein